MNTMREHPILEVDHVTKMYEKAGSRIVALKDVSLRAEHPQVIGLVGLNGAGKTTLINIIAGILIPDDGIARINGEETWKKPGKLIGYPYIPFQDPRMTVKDVIDVLELFYGEGDWEKYAELLGLRKEWNTEIQRLSTGWKRRVEILAAMGQEKPVILLDEVTNGLDVVTADTVLDAMKEKGKRSVVIFASHIFNHVERVADRIVIIHQGRILRDSKIEELCGGGSLESVFREVVG